MRILDLEIVGYLEGSVNSALCNQSILRYMIGKFYYSVILFLRVLR